MLRYRFTKGERICWTVKHLSTTEATMQGKTETTKSRTISTKVWEVKDVDAEGNVTLVHSVSDVDMWQKISDRPEVRYNSRTDATPPPQYMHVAKTVGTPIATVRISPAGKVLERNGSLPQANFGLGEIAVPLPVGPVKIGQQWHTTSEILARRQDGDQEADQDADGVHAQVGQDGHGHDRGEDGSRDARQRSADSIAVGPADHERRDSVRCGRGPDPGSRNRLG